MDIEEPAYLKFRQGCLNVPRILQMRNEFAKPIYVLQVEQVLREDAEAKNENVFDLVIWATQ